MAIAPWLGGNPHACAGQSRESEFFSPADRSQAAARAIQLCKDLGEEGGACDRPDTALGADLPEAQGKIRAQYEILAEACRSQTGDDGHNPCRDALRYWGGKISAEDIGEPLALLHENCRSGGRIAGCDALYRIYKDGSYAFANDRRGNWPTDPAQALEALKIGCSATLEAVGNCGSLGLWHENAGYFKAAGDAYRLGCETGMRAGKDEHYGQGRVCYWAAKNARNQLHDYDDARRWFRFVCEEDSNPFACKFLGLMEAQAEGAPADPMAAIARYRQGCYLEEDITLGDGQACLFLGQALIAARKDVACDILESARDEQVPVGGPPPDDLIMEVLAQASQAFLRGCDDGVAEACTAARTLLADWTRGDYPRLPGQCRVLDAEGRGKPAQACTRFDLYLQDVRADLPSTIYVWPDGQRTVLSIVEEAELLNGAPAETYTADSGGDCLRNLDTGRSFCIE